MNVNQNNYNIEQFSVATSFRELGIKFYAERILKQLKWRGGERVLDIGCGPGDVTKNCIYSFLPQNFGKLVCADISPEMLKACKSKFTGIENVEFLEMDIMKTPEQSMKGTFDRILSMYCFMYVSDQKKALQNVFDLLKPGGDCWILQVTSTPLVSPIFTLAKTPKWKDKLANFRDFYVYQFYEDPNPIENGETYMKSVGFTDVSVNLDRVYNQMESLESYKVILEGLPNPAKCMEEKDKEELLRDQIEIARALNVFKENSQYEATKEPHQILEFYGRKPQ